MPYPQPATVLRQWDKARAVNPALTTQQMAMQICMPHDVFLAKIREAQYLLTKRKAPVQIGAVTTMEFDASGKNWSQWFLLQSDNHHDAVSCNRDLETLHLDEAVKRKAVVCMFGDIFTAMQGRFDPRRSMAELRPEYLREDYYSYLVRDYGKYYGKYASIIGVMSDGNHELTVLKNANMDMLGMLVKELNQQGGSVIHGGYGGWILLSFDVGGKKIVKKLKYFHGSGGEAPVTRGVIQTNRQAVYLPGADIVVNGHSHNQYHLAICREIVDDDGRHYFHLQHHIRTPGYMQAYGDGTRGWDVTRGGVPKPIGAVWLQATRRGYDIDFMILSDIRAPDVVSIDPNELYTGRVYAQDGEVA